MVSISDRTISKEIMGGEIVNLNDLARGVSREEGKKIQLPIGQIKEVMKCAFALLGKESDEEIIKIINKYR